MAHPLTCRIVDGPDGRFAVVAVSPSGTVYRRGGLPSRAAARACLEDLRAVMAACGASVVEATRDPARAAGRGEARLSGRRCGSWPH